MEKYLVLEYLKNFSPVLKGKTNNLEDAKALRDALAKINPSDTFIVVEVLS
jgi:hypothetical protein